MATGCPLLDSEFVARQNGKPLPCARLVIENEELRDEFSKMDEWHSKELFAAIDENKKPRELVRDMWRFMGAACKKYPRLFDPVCAGGQMVQLNMIDAFEQRMSELGVDA